MEKRIISHGTSDYKQSVALRVSILREPLGLTFSTEQLDAEKAEIHLGLFEQQQLLACLILKRVNPTEMKMRQVAVDVARQRQGLGRILVAWSEELATARGAARMALHARESALPFYQRLGYVASGAVFEEVGLPHRFMAKALGPQG